MATHAHHRACRPRDLARPLSPLTLAALALVAKGWPPYRVALQSGVRPNTVYLALARARKRLALKAEPK